MKIEYLQQFITLSQVKNYQKMADDLFISQSTLTKHVQSLEKDLGYQLVRRKRRNFELTDSGLLVVRYGQGLLNANQLLMMALKYTWATAPIFMPNTIGGYMPGPRDYPGNKSFLSNSNTIILALKHGYVVVSAGLRGRTLPTGHVPAFIVDMKATVRWVKYNAGLLPGYSQKIITNGTSAGGATSALTRASRNDPFFDKYFAEIGATPASDDIFAVSAYCPIHNLENDNAAYEWEFSGINDWHRTKPEGFKDGKPNFVPISGELTLEE